MFDVCTTGKTAHIHTIFKFLLHTLHHGDACVAVFTPRKYSWYLFSPGAESTPGPWYGRKEHVTDKSSDITGNRFWDRPTSSAAP